MVAFRNGRMDRARVCVNTIMLMRVEEIKAALREEGLCVTGQKEVLANRLAPNLASGHFPSRVLPSTKQLKFVLYLWRKKELNFKTHLQWSDINTKHRISQWIHHWKSE